MPKGNKKEIIPGLPFHSDICKRACQGDLPSMVVLLLHTLRAGMNSKNKVNWRSQKTLASEMGCSRKTVNLAIQFAKAKGLIQIKSHKRGLSGEISFNEIPIKEKEGETESYKGCNNTLQGVSQKVTGGCNGKLQEGVTLRATNKASNKSSKNKSIKSSSLIVKNDDDTIIQTDSRSNVSSAKIQKDGTGSKSESMAGEKSGQGKKSKWPPAVLEKKIIAAIEKGKGKVVAEKANRFAAGLVYKVKPVHQQGYKNKILESILRGEQADFKPDKMCNYKPMITKVINLRRG